MTLSKIRSLVLLAIPDNCVQPYAYLVRAAVKHPEVAAFPALFLQAYSGDADAIRQALTTSAIVRHAAEKSGVKGEELIITNAILYLCQELAEKLEREEREKQDADALDFLTEMRHDDKTRVSEKVETEPKAAVKTQPRNKNKFNSVKPGTMALAEGVK
jgi:hypothetical protein